MNREKSESLGIRSMMEQIKESFGVVESYYLNAGKDLKEPAWPVRHSTGFKTLDRVCGGLPHGDLSLVAARRSALAAEMARQMAVGAALGDKAVLVCCARQDIPRWSLQTLLNEARLDYHRFLYGDLSRSDWDRVARAAGRLSDADLSLCASRELDQIGALARDWRREHKGEGLILVDGVERMGAGRGADPASNCEGLKALAQELDLPLVASLSLGAGLGPVTGDFMNLEDLRDLGDLDLIAGQVFLAVEGSEYTASIESGEGRVHILTTVPLQEGNVLVRLPY